MLIMLDTAYICKHGLTSLESLRLRKFWPTFAYLCTSLLEVYLSDLSDCFRSQNQGGISINCVHNRAHLQLCGAAGGWREDGGRMAESAAGDPSVQSLIRCGEYSSRLCRITRTP